jgi:hypothetical protein
MKRKSHQRINPISFINFVAKGLFASKRIRPQGEIAKQKPLDELNTNAGIWKNNQTRCIDIGSKHLSTVQPTPWLRQSQLQGQSSTSSEESLWLLIEKSFGQQECVGFSLDLY